MNILPPPHPLDYDWRFTSDTQSFLTGEVLRLMGKEESVCVFGAPSLFLELQGAGSNPILIDKNAFLAERLGSARVICADLFMPLPTKLRCSLVIADPPWYLEYYEAFILRASEALEQEGYLLLSMLPSLTRPSALGDRVHVIEYCRRAGFDLVECAASNLSYESPPFERAALSTEGLSCEQWRSGDLFVFKKVSDLEGDLQNGLMSTEDIWHTFEVCNIVVKIRDRNEAESIFNYELASKGPYFTSVSRRAPERSNIDLWTSDNRVYTLSRPSIMKHIFMHLDSGLSNAVFLTSRAYNLSKPEEEAISQLFEEIIESRLYTTPCA